MYKLQTDYNNKLCAVLRIADNVSIPFDPANTDYAAYLAWLEAGNQPEAADEIKGE